MSRLPAGPSHPSQAWAPSLASSPRWLSVLNGALPTLRESLQVGRGQGWGRSRCQGWGARASPSAGVCPPRPPNRGQVLVSPHANEEFISEQREGWSPRQTNPAFRPPRQFACNPKRIAFPTFQRFKSHLSGNLLALT